MSEISNQIEQFLKILISVLVFRNVTKNRKRIKLNGLRTFFVGSSSMVKDNKTSLGKFIVLVSHYIN